MGLEHDLISQGFRLGSGECLPREVATPILTELGIKVADTTGPNTYQFFMSDGAEAEVCLLGTIMRKSKPGQAEEGQNAKDVMPELFDVVSVFGGVPGGPRTYLSQEIAPPLKTEQERLEALGRLVVVASETMGWVTFE